MRASRRGARSWGAWPRAGQHARRGVARSSGWGVDRRRGAEGAWASAWASPARDAEMRAASLPAGHPRRSPHAREQRQKRPSRGVAARRRRAARERAGEGSAFRVSLSRDSAVRGTMTLRRGFHATWTGALARAARAARSEGEISNPRGVHSGIRFQRFRVFTFQSPECTNSKSAVELRMIHCTIRTF